MPPMPARCRTCGHVFTTFSLDDIVGLTMNRNRVTCPKPECGGRGQVIEGRFNIRSGGIEMLEGPQWSLDLIEQLRLTLVRVVDEEPDDPIEQVEMIDSQLGGLLRRATHGWTKESVLAFLALLLATLTWAGVEPDDVAEAAEIIRHRALELIENAADHDPRQP